MFVFRSIVVGLLGASCVLLATRPQAHVVVGSAPQIVVLPSSSAVEALGTHARALELARAAAAGAEAEAEARMSPPVTLIDVAPGVRGDLLANMIVLAANEHITAIDDAPVRDARVALASLELRSRQYIDVSITSDAGATRRVLVLPR